MRFDKQISKILEVVADLPPPPPAIIQQSQNTLLTFDDIKNLITKHEGYRNKVYLDSLNIPTIGIGLNLLRPDAKSILNKVGANYSNILNGSETLTDDQVKEVFQLCLKIAYNDVKKYVPEFDTLPKNVKLGLIDMSFNLGYTRLSKFVKTREFIVKGDYKNAANELNKSKWASQVGNRAKSIINLFLTA